MTLKTGASEECIAKYIKIENSCFKFEVIIFHYITHCDQTNAA